jgi:hypothetical protein
MASKTQRSRARRAVMLGALGAVALVAVGAWGVIKLGEGDWLIGGAFVVCAVLGLRSVAAAVGRVRRR